MPEDSIDGLLGLAAEAAKRGNGQRAAVLLDQIARRAKETGQVGLEAAARQFAVTLVPDVVVPRTP